MATTDERETLASDAIRAIMAGHRTRNAFTVTVDPDADGCPYTPDRTGYTMVYGIGPFYVSAPRELRDVMPMEWRAYDDDGRLCYRGLCTGEAGAETAFYWATVDVGATRLDVRRKGKSWSTLFA